MVHSKTTEQSNSEEPLGGLVNRMFDGSDVGVSDVVGLDVTEVEGVGDGVYDSVGQGIGVGLDGGRIEVLVRKSDSLGALKVRLYQRLWTSPK